MSKKTTEPSALDKQVGGDHYQMPIQHAEFVTVNEIPYLEANAIKYIIRHQKKNGVEDLKKAMHYLEIIAQLRYETTLTTPKEI